MSEPLGEPVWWEMYVVVHGREPMIDPRYDTREELVEAAAQLIADFKDDQDLASWAVKVTPHWCNGNEICECLSVYSDTTVDEYKGLTVGDLEGGQG